MRAGSLVSTGTGNTDELVPEAAIYLVVVGGGLALGGCFAAYVLYTLMAG